MDNNSERNSQSRVMSYDEEESGWTAYFDEFFDDHQYSEEINSCFSASVESSLISDAASSSALVKKASAFHHHHHHHHDRNNKRSTTSSKRRKTEVADNGLEDTASSSVNSPKIYHLINQLGRKPAEAKDHAIDISKEKAGSISAQGDGRADSNINEEEEEESELKKRGLCLVPLSMLVKYI
ncbi:vascular-related unknown protein 2-like [Mangifera indica]|uniref:vascular-related unknown protein 2-like n=1 Tax=Mangifera indica TaxID=29780 RepID=UPI001CFC0175|nr:vascular-related unknown protein 2-like [Mangifera indica]